MTGLKPYYDDVCWWLEPNMEWEEAEKLIFNPENEWIQLALKANNALLYYCEEDYFSMPFIHRSPLDAANGIRGSKLFLEMYTDPERVKKLVNWCADWQIQLQNYIYETANPQKTGVLELWEFGDLITKCG